MTVSRRTVLTGMGATLAPVPALAASPAASDLSAILARHADATEAFRAAHARADAINHAIADRLPAGKVQIGKRLVGWDGDGTKHFAPIFAYFDAAIDADCDRALEARLSFNHPRREQQIRQESDARRSRLKAELAAQREEARRIEREAGLTDAEAQAEQIGAVLERIECEILAFVPSTLAEAAQLAAWAYAGQGGNAGKEETALCILATIAAAENSEGTVKAAGA